MLDQTLEAIVASYKRKAPDIDDAELRQLIKDETWLTAGEAKDLGLCDEVLDGVSVKAQLGDGGALRRYHRAPLALLAQLEEQTPPAPAHEPAPTDAPPTPTNQPTAGALVNRIVRGCADAGISNLVEALTMSADLKDDASVDAAISRAKSVRDLCVSARLPELAGDYVKAGLSVDAVRARLFDKLVGSGFGEINNTPPLDPAAPPPAKPKAVSPTKTYANRRAASAGKSKASKGEAQ